uniref:VPS10 domain-containing protein n=1 Tax=Neobodo designis TaxID=312471 RepID=A0A7S1MKW5_NEODS|mmetsp:Transcript_4232/g.13533  ORF Transcript_4232/g.13533 Transcript_4232/m.13533 type:complete len:979 (+) Transcript_4232:99-3035(+)|eukprot:CAMPEP_0174852124 /NCGR_PEP_ID=MMETSP1114-20130205/25197_1 /TAXON_ID=312471 /ORGANISM="Neobodo designis, Strain CCAP 1951/1" /LENGTH=978 /DNA_ID=CAMNT_0016086703 /DNA_START=99 /DNA_END=3035 /DNA_ORIENTATION=-
MRTAVRSLLLAGVAAVLVAASLCVTGTDALLTARRHHDGHHHVQANRRGPSGNDLLDALLATGKTDKKHPEENAVHPKVRSFAAKGDDDDLPVDSFTNPDGVKVTHMTLPGSVDQAMFLTDTLMLVTSRGDIYLTANHGRTWKCWTCGQNFGGVLSGKVQAVFSQTDALSTERLEKSLRARYNRNICVVTQSATYLVSMLPQATAAPPTELVIAASPALSAHAPGVHAGSVRFDALEFHPTQYSKKAFGFITDPSCDPFRNHGRCRSFAFVTTDMKHFYLVPAYEPYLLMWENPVSAATTNFSVPYVERHRNAFDMKAYNPGDFFMVLTSDVNARWGRLVRVPLDGVDYSSVSEAALGPKLTLLRENVADARAIVGHEYVSGIDWDKRQATMSVSHDNFATLIQLEFPRVIFNQDGESRDLGKEMGYTVLDDREDVFINVYRGTQTERQLWGHTYQSGLRGLRFDVSLPYTRAAPPSRGGGAAGTVDFHRVSGLDGILIANQVRNPDDARCRRCGEESCAAMCKVTTVISRDNGKTWQSLRTAPSSRGDMIDPNDSGPLHLHGLSDHVAPILSSRHAPGLLIGSGNQGHYLSQGTDTVSDVYLSRNGGRSWVRIANGPHLYGEGDLGALVYLVRHGTVSGATNAHMNYSADGGLSFKSTPFLKSSDTTQLETRWIGRPVHDPLTRAAVVVAQDSHNRVHFIRVDFSGADERARCTGLGSPGDDGSDFETFTPQSHDGNGCLLGRRSTYVRKKPGSNCWIMPSHARTTIDYSLPTKTVQCACTYDDFECDFGYHEQPDGKCYRGKDAPTPDQICDARASGADWAKLYTDGSNNYLATKGYRRIAGDACVDGIEQEVVPTPRYLPCPRASAGKGSSGWVTFLVLALVGGAFFALYRVNPRFRDVVDDTVGAVRPVVASAVDGVRNVFTGPRQPRYGSLPTDDVADADSAPVPDQPGSETPPPAVSPAAHPASLVNDEDEV